MTAIVPTVGRVIWFQPHVEMGLGSPDTDKPYAGIVANVNEDGTINIGGFDRTGTHFAVQSVTILELVEGEALPEGFEYGHFAYWMPYQKAVAASQEAKATATGVGAGGAKDPV